MLQIARDTVGIVNSINQWSPTNGLCMAWPPEARVTANATEAMHHFTHGLNRTMMPNLWPNIRGGCNMEQSGATAAVNDLLLASHEGFIRLFPAAWAPGQSGSFKTLRAEGAFLVSAATSGGSDVHGVRILSLAGQHLRIFNPFVSQKMSVCVRDAASGIPVASTDEGKGVVGFATDKGSSYLILPCAVRESK
jgi:hypothetical protein